MGGRGGGGSFGGRGGFGGGRGRGGRTGPEMQPRVISNELIQ